MPCIVSAQANPTGTLLHGMIFSCGLSQVMTQVSSFTIRDSRCLTVSYSEPPQFASRAPRGGRRREPALMRKCRASSLTPPLYHRGRRRRCSAGANERELLLPATSFSPAAANKGDLALFLSFSFLRERRGAGGGGKMEWRNVPNVPGLVAPSQRARPNRMHTHRFCKSGSLT